MSEGERLLQNHKKHVSLYNALQKRMEQCRAELCRPEEVIENLALGHGALVEVIGGHKRESATEHVAACYHDVYEQERQQLQVKIRQFEEKLQILQDMINLYDAIMAGLEPVEEWLVEAYFIKARTLDDLAAEKDCAKSTVLTKKRRIIRKVDALLRELCPSVGVEAFYEISF